MRNRFMQFATVAVATLATSSVMAESNSSFEGAARDAWITGKIETVYALNPHLNPFAIDTDVENGVVILTGAVQSDIDRDLAGELAKGVDGVVEIENNLEVDARSMTGGSESSHGSGERRDFGSWVDDATTTAAVKSKLIANSNTKGLKIDVDTNDDVVTLSGRVNSDAERSLAEELARNTTDVENVRNNLVVDPS